MVQNHSLKKQARETAQALHIPYTEALQRVTELKDFNPLAKLSPRQLIVASEAADALRNGFDVLVYGGTSSGKTSMIHAVMEALSEIPRILTTNPSEALLTKRRVPFTVVAFDELESLETQEREKFALAAFDEPLSVKNYALAEGFTAKPLLVSVHGMNSSHAISRLNSIPRTGISKRKDWNFAYYLHCTVDRDGNRVANLYADASEEKNERSLPKDYLTELRAMADSLGHVLPLENPVPIEDAMERGAEFHGTTPSRMRYALSFAHTMGQVEINYDRGTVTRLARQP